MLYIRTIQISSHLHKNIIDRLSEQIDLDVTKIWKQKSQVYSLKVGTWLFVRKIPGRSWVWIKPMRNQNSAQFTVPCLEYVSAHTVLQRLLIYTRLTHTCDHTDLRTTEVTVASANGPYLFTAVQNVQNPKKMRYQCSLMLAWWPAVKNLWSRSCSHDWTDSVRFLRGPPYHPP